MSKLRSSLYRTARALGDAEAALKGPEAYVKRRVRRKAYGGWLRVLERLLRGLR